MKIVTPELNNPTMKEALSRFPDLEIISANSLDEAAKILAEGKADSMIAGLDYSSRDVLLAYKTHLPLTSAYFSSCFVGKKGAKHLIIADGGVNKAPDEAQLYTIIEDTAKTHLAYFNTQPKIAMLSYSTNGSGGKNPDLAKIHAVIMRIHENHPDWLIDGEMQLDAAIIPEIGQKKFANSPVAGYANILIVPDLNSGNILYKSMEHLGGWTMAGPIIQGFSRPLADLSRGSSVEDVALTVEVIRKVFFETIRDQRGAERATEPHNDGREGARREKYFSNYQKGAL